MPSQSPDLDGFGKHLLLWAWVDAMELDEILDRVDRSRPRAEALDLARRAIHDLPQAGLVWFSSEPGPNGDEVSPADVDALLAKEEWWTCDGLTMWPTREGERLAVGYEAWDGPPDTWPRDTASAE